MPRPFAHIVRQKTARDVFSNGTRVTGANTLAGVGFDEGESEGA
jgi:hypothetical protein